MKTARGKLQALTLKRDRIRSTAPLRRRRRRSGPASSRATNRAPDELIRFVLGPDNAVVPDLKRKLPGRGVWVGLSPGAGRPGGQEAAFARGLSEKALASPDSARPDRGAAASATPCRLSLANKAGLVTTGFAKVESAIASGTIAALVHARDGARGRQAQAAAGAAPPLRRRYAAGLRTFRLRTNSIPPSGAAMWFTPRLDLARRQRFFSLPAWRLAVYRGDGEADGRRSRAQAISTVNEALEQGFKADGTNGRGPWDDERYERFEQFRRQDLDACAEQDAVAEAPGRTGRRAPELLAWPHQGCRRRKGEAPRP